MEVYVSVELVEADGEIEIGKRTSLQRANALGITRMQGRNVIAITYFPSTPSLSGTYI